MTEVANIDCPNCQAILAIDGADLPPRVRCTRCGAQFDIGDAVVAVRTSRKAVVSLVLGICSLPCTLITGVPAIILGILALRDIRRERLKGRGLAIGGIASGIVINLLGVVVILPAIALMIRLNNTTDPKEISARFAMLAQFDWPPDIEPRRAFQMFGSDCFRFTDDPGDGSFGTHIDLFYYSGPNGMNAGLVQQRKAMRVAVLPDIKEDEVRRQTYTVRGRKTAVTVRIGIDQESGRRCRSYKTVLPTNAGQLLFILTTDAAQTNVTQPADAPQFGLNESQVRQIVESFKARDGTQ